MPLTFLILNFLYCDLSGINFCSLSLPRRGPFGFNCPLNTTLDPTAFVPEICEISYASIRPNELGPSRLDCIDLPVPRSLGEVGLIPSRDPEYSGRPSRLAFLNLLFPAISPK